MKAGKIISLAIVLALCLTMMVPAALAETYEATAQGFGGEVKVALTIENGALTAVTAEGASETTGIGSRAIELLPGTMLATNSVEVDGVAGATVTSTAVLDAAKAALAASGGVLVHDTVGSGLINGLDSFGVSGFGFFTGGLLELLDLGLNSRLGGAVALVQDRSHENALLSGLDVRQVLTLLTE